MKKQYMKPSMKVFDLKHRQMILCGSPGDRSIPEYDDDFSYLPRIGEDRNKLA